MATGTTGTPVLMAMRNAPALNSPTPPLFALIAGALGEDGEAVPAPDHRGGVFQGLHRPADVVPLDIDAAQQVHPPAEQGDAGQLLFGQDAVGAVKADQHQRDVEIAAVVAHKHHRAPGGDVLPPFHDQLDPGHPQQAAAPARDVAVHDPAQRPPGRRRPALFRRGAAPGNTAAYTRTYRCT